MYLDNYIKEITQLCQQNSVRTLYAFGSVLTDRFNEESDIDLVVDINSDDALDYGGKYFDLKFTLEDLLKRKIDLLESSEIKNKYFLEELEETKSLIYG
jgi:predicted nucleotidyltransferase